MGEGRKGREGKGEREKRIGKKKNLSYLQTDFFLSFMFIKNIAFKIYSLKSCQVKFWILFLKKKQDISSLNTNFYYKWPKIVKRLWCIYCMKVKYLGHYNSAPLCACNTMSSLILWYHILKIKEGHMFQSIKSLIYPFLIPCCKWLLRVKLRGEAGLMNGFCLPLYFFFFTFLTQKSIWLWPLKRKS